MDLALSQSDLIFKNGDFDLSSVPKAMPLVLAATTHAGSWPINTGIGVDLTGFKESLSLYDLRMCFAGYTDCIIKGFDVNQGSVTIYVEVEKGVSSVNI